MTTDSYHQEVPQSSLEDRVERMDKRIQNLEAALHLTIKGAWASDFANRSDDGLYGALKLLGYVKEKTVSEKRKDALVFNCCLAIMAVGFALIYILATRTHVFML